MSINLLDSITSQITPDLISKASAFLGETPVNTSKALTGIVPALLDRFSSFASAPGGVEDLTDMIKSATGEGRILNNVSSLFSGGHSTTSAITQGKEILGNLLGNKTSSMAAAVSSFSGISSGSAGSLMALAVPMILAAFAKLRTTQSLTAGGLASLLSSQRAGFASALPSGWSHFTNAPDIQGVRSVTVTPEALRTRSSWSWLPLLLVPLLGFGLYQYLHGCGTTPVTTALAMKQVKLCNGESLSLLQDSFNYNLATFLASGNNSELPKTFVFDHLNFDSATTTLTPDSRATVNDLIVVMKACPNAQVQLVGHTDSTGDPTSNVTLSQNRADTVKDILASNGIAADRMSTVGYGQARPIASNDTDEGKARNRRTELVVVKK